MVIKDYEKLMEISTLFKKYLRINKIGYVDDYGAGGMSIGYIIVSDNILSETNSELLTFPEFNFIKDGEEYNPFNEIASFISEELKLNTDIIHYCIIEITISGGYDPDLRNVYGIFIPPLNKD